MELLPILIFSSDRKSIYLEDRKTAQVFFSFSAHNQTENPGGDPLECGSWGQAPQGFVMISPPDFISREFKYKFYLERFGLNLNTEAESLAGESYIQKWGEFLEEEMGRVRFALGTPLAPPGTGDRAAWDRELLIHGGKTFETPTKGCLRMRDKDLEDLAYHLIRIAREGKPLIVIKISG